MRILFVAISESVHTARWISQLSGENWDIHLFPSDGGYALHSDLRDLTVYSLFRGRKNGYDRSLSRKGLYWPFRRGAGRLKWISERVAPNMATEASRLARRIRMLRPDVIHVLEMQRAGYLMLEAKRHLADFPLPPCIYSSWGSDLFLFGKQPDHEKRIREFLTACDYYIADCQRDVSLVREFGFKGETLGTFTAAGGQNLEHMRQFRQEGPSSCRRVIALKGYHGLRGANGVAAVEALRLVGALLTGYEIVVYLASDETRSALSKLSSIRGLKISELPYSPHDEVLKLMGQARVAIGIGLSDGTALAMLEAMVMGALPIQSDTVSSAEWIHDGKNGLLVSQNDPESIAEVIRRGLSDDALVDRAADLNRTMAEAKLDVRVVRPQVVDIYHNVCAKQGEAGLAACGK